jgi:L-fuconolactonase
MDAVGVDGVIIDEWWGFDDRLLRKPHFRLLNGSVRHLFPFALEACMRYPDRMACTSWVDRDDPDMTAVMEAIAANPTQVCIRIVVRPGRGDDVALEAGAYHKQLAIAENLRIPVMIILPRVDLERRRRLLAPIFKKFGSLQFILDHCGVLALSDRDIENGQKGPAVFRETIAYAEYPNVALKWDHAPTVSAEGFPYSDVLSALRSVVDAFGKERVMWGSDSTQTHGDHSWADALYSVREASEFSQDEKAWILGRTARKVLDWPKQQAPDGTSYADYNASTWRVAPQHQARSILQDRRRS